MSYREKRYAAMTDVLDQALAANARYAADFGARPAPPPPPARHSAILTCDTVEELSAELPAFGVSGASMALWMRAR